MVPDGAAGRRSRAEGVPPRRRMPTGSPRRSLSWRRRSGTSVGLAPACRGASPRGKRPLYRGGRRAPPEVVPPSRPLPGRGSRGRGRRRAAELGQQVTLAACWRPPGRRRRWRLRGRTCVCGERGRGQPAAAGPRGRSR
eukprot:15463448-Alexandrium_andersonii.AAC.1